MRKTLLSFTAVLCVIASLGQIEGPYSGANYANVPIPGSNKSWINITNAGASDDLYASYGSLTGSSPSYTDYLLVSDFGFAVPGGVNITGIVVEMERSDPNSRTADYRIRIVKSGVIGTAERASGAQYPSSDGTQTFGNSGDLWGETWTVADINAANFGVAVAATRTVSGTNAGLIDNIRITVYYDFVILPVKLSAFNAKKNGSIIDINWSTSEESNMSRYEVERSVNGNSFATLETINSRNQAIASTYTATDDHPNKGINYYRLKMIDNSGRITYSKIVAVHFSNGKNVVLYPNILQRGADLNITNPNGELITVDFYGLSGQQLGSVKTAGSIVPTSPLIHTKGMVLYKLRNKDGIAIGTGTLQIY